MVGNTEHNHFEQAMEKDEQPSEQVCDSSECESSLLNLQTQIFQMEKSLDIALAGFYDECKEDDECKADIITVSSQSTSSSDFTAAHHHQDGGGGGPLLDDSCCHQDLGGCSRSGGKKTKKNNNNNNQTKERSSSPTDDKTPPPSSISIELREHMELLRKEFLLAKMRNQRLMTASAAASTAFRRLNQHTKQVEEKNKKLTNKLAEAQRANEEARTTIVALQEQLKLQKATYIAEVHARLHYQDALSEIVDVVRKKIKGNNPGLVEEVRSIADRCESQYGEFPFNIWPLNGEEERSDPATLASKFKSFFWRVS